MSDNFTKRIVQDTFENPFDKSKYTNFIKNLLNHIDDSEETKFVYQGQYIPQVYKDSVLSLERIGKYEDNEGKTIDILIVYLKKEKSLDRARTLQRNFVAWYLDGSRGGKLKDAALVAFVSSDADSWRFSLVKMDYKIQEAKVKKELTPAKRYSFLVGPDEKCHTAQSRLIPIIQDDKNNPTLKQIEEAFSIEKVTKEFFEKYRDLFIRLKENLDEIVKNDTKIKKDFEAKNIDTSSFAKKLLGQLVFLYFLQKKGWFGVERDSLWGTGPKNFLRKLFNQELVSYKNFFNEVLEPLFYEALAKKRDKNFYSRLNCKIPFLNGGLFDPINDYDWVFTDINLDNELFSNNYKTKEGDLGNGILDVFDRYNFTVREDEPLEKEVAVDPEMLGKVFENLLEVKDRKSKGTYYTPREIVHYMCQESLINYLHSELDGQVEREDLELLVKKGVSYIHNDQSVSLGIKRYEEQIPKSVKKFTALIDIKLADIKVCDPAVGSGAFLVGMMTEIVNCREVLSYLLNDVGERDIYKFKRWAIQHSLYGVDIDPSAVEVAKLRLWLSLVVEEDDIKKIKPLPNLDYKIMQGNSLLEEFKGIKLFDEKLLTKGKPVEYDYLAELKQKELELGGKLLGYYQKNPSWMKNRSIARPQELAELEFEMDKVRLAIKKNSDSKKTKNELSHQPNLELFQGPNRDDTWLRLKRLYSRYFKSYDSDKKKRIRDSIEKVIWELIETTIKDEGKTDVLKEIEAYKSNGIRPFFLWKLYFADVFQEKGGFDVVIANPPYVGNKGHKDEFQQIQNGNLGMFYQRRMDLFYFFFHLALNIGKENSAIAFITTNYYLTATSGTRLRTDIKERSCVKTLMNFNELKIFESALGQHNIITIISKTRNKSGNAHTYFSQRTGFANTDLLQTILDGNDKCTIDKKIPQSDLYDGTENYIRLSGTSKFSKDPTQIVLAKILKSGTNLGSICNINQGIVSGADRISKKHLKGNSLDVNLGEGIFILKPIEIKEKRISLSSEHVKPWFKNSDIRRYWTNQKIKEYVLYFKDKKQVQPIEKEILSHFQKFRDLLIRRLSVCKKNKFQWNIVSKWIQRGEFYLLFYPRKQEIFESAKIVVPQRSPRNTFGYNESPWYASADVYFITSIDTTLSLKYILSILNSTLYYLWFYLRGKRKGETLELYQKPLSEVPIKKISISEQKPFIDIVNKILTITKSDDYQENPEKQAKVKDYEKQIDQMVYKLYGLNKEEIELVEKSSK